MVCEESQKQAPLSVGSLMSEMTECDRKREAECKLGSEGRKNVRFQLLVVQEHNFIDLSRWVHLRLSGCPGAESLT